MKEKIVSTGVFVCLLILTCLLAFYALVIFPGVPALRWFLATSAVVITRLDAPSWVQAVGSIAAIGFAWLGISRQLKHTEEVRKRESHAKDVALTRGCLAALIDARRAIDHISEKMREVLGRQATYHFGPERLDEVQYILRSLVEKDLPPEVVPLVLQAQREIAYTRAAIRRIHGGAAITQQRLLKSMARSNSLTRAITRMRVLVRDPEL